jgi:flagellar biosynthesis/type III secretory pathway M-ring protein FliF/YscJ
MMTFSDGMTILDTPMTYSETNWTKPENVKIEDDSTNSLKIMGIISTIVLLAILAAGISMHFLIKRRRGQEREDLPMQSDDPEDLDIQPADTPTDLENEQTEPAENQNTEMNVHQAPEHESEQPPACHQHPFRQVLRPQIIEDDMDDTEELMTMETDFHII